MFSFSPTIFFLPSVIPLVPSIAYLPLIFYVLPLFLLSYSSHFFFPCLTSRFFSLINPQFVSFLLVLSSCHLRTCLPLSLPVSLTCHSLASSRASPFTSHLPSLPSPLPSSLHIPVLPFFHVASPVPTLLPTCLSPMPLPSHLPGAQARQVEVWAAGE